jgi:hypothetical protein
MCGFKAKANSRTGLSRMSGSAWRTRGHTRFLTVRIPTTSLLYCVNIACRPGPPLARWTEILQRHNQELTCFCVRVAARARAYFCGQYASNPRRWPADRWRYTNCRRCTSNRRRYKPICNPPLCGIFAGALAVSVPQPSEETAETGQRLQRVKCCRQPVTTAHQRLGARADCCCLPMNGGACLVLPCIKCKYVT